MRRGMHLDGQDIFVEVDWMTGYRMIAQNLVIRAFGRHDITLHIDDGCMGGGGSVRHNAFITFWDPNQNNAGNNVQLFYNYKNGEDLNGNGVLDTNLNEAIAGVDYNHDGDERDVLNEDYDRNGILEPSHFTLERRGIFHYCIFADERFGTTSSGVSWSNEDDFVVAAGSWIRDEGEIAIAGTFMHELGHNLGLTKNANIIWPEGVFLGIDIEENDPDYHYDDYHSCMNYKYQTTLVDYSDGSRDPSGVNDHDDWSNLNLRGITRWNIHE